MNNSHPLKDKKIAILATHGFEESELTEPLKALIDAGADVRIVSLAKGHIRGWRDDNWGKNINVHCSISEARSQDFDALMIPGGVMNPDKLRTDEEAVDFIQGFVESGKPIAAICHGPQVLIETGMISSLKVTSAPAIKTDLQNAGGFWFDAEVVTDGGLVTSRGPQDLPAFNRAMINLFQDMPQQRTLTKNHFIHPPH